MMESSSLTEELQRASSSSNNVGNSSPLFSIGKQNLSYEACWDILHLHKKWIRNETKSVCDDAWKIDGGHNTSSPPSQPKNELVIGYLADNSPDLLLSMLGCIDLAHRSSNNNNSSDNNNECEEALSPLPAMINVRWTPLEIQRALRVYTDNKNKQTVGVERPHVTIILYGQGYEESARQAVHLMNGDTINQHFAVALPLPLFANDTNSTRNHPSLYHYNLSKTKEISNSEALILFTSGTSSPNGAKGVRLSHRSLFIQAHAKTCAPCNYDSQSRVVATTVPWFHVGGISSALAVVLGGGCLVFPSDDVEDQNGSEGVQRKGFQPNIVLQSLLPRLLSKQGGDSAAESISANTLVVVPAMLHAMFQQQQLQKLPPNDNVRLILVGGQSIGDSLYQQARHFFPKARIVQTYACTEAGSSITFLDLGYSTSNSVGAAVKADVEQKPNVDGATLVGVPPQHIEIGIFDERSDKHNLISLPKGQMGIIGTRGPHVMSGYWKRGSIYNRDEHSSQVEDWMLTNDLGYIDNQGDNHLYFCGRVNDVIRTGGESVLATEVENVIIMHSDVEECAIFALPDEKFGDAVCAAIVLKGEARLREEDGAVEDDQLRMLMRKHCEQQQLAGFKRPRRVFCMHSLPRNSSGKVLKYDIVKACATCTSNRSRL
jgi:acyl-CoA synthetase (AMP-forming)/AMP-acid ligase II